MAGLASISCRIGAVASGLLLLAACATPAPPPPPPPPPVVQEVIPYRPLPPGGADYAMVVPPLGPDGVRVTPNKHLDANETLWHLRSGWNVAALNCLGPEYQPILDSYAAFLKKYAKKLKATNAAIDAKYRKDAATGRDAIMARETQATQLYNYFALPGARAAFCNAALATSTDFTASAPKDPADFATANLARLDAAFETFFADYDKYKIDSAAWDDKYGTRYGASQPGYVAVHGSATPSVAATLVDAGTPKIVGGVVDPNTGALVPVVPAPQANVQTPVVEPVPLKPGAG